MEEKSDYEESLDKLITRLLDKSDGELREILITNKNRLIRYSTRGKIIHDQLTLILIHYLARKYDVIDVEHDVGALRCDIYAKKGNKTTIIEVETPFAKSDDIIKFDLTPLRYYLIRTIGKIRYSFYADEFYLAYPDYLYLEKCNPTYKFFHSKKEERNMDKAKEFEEIVGEVYKEPPITAEEIIESHLEGIYRVDIDNLDVELIDYF